MGPALRVSRSYPVTLTIRGCGQLAHLPVSVRTLSFCAADCQTRRDGPVLDEDLHHHPCCASSQVPGLHGRSIPFKHP